MYMHLQSPQSLKNISKSSQEILHEKQHHVPKWPTIIVKIAYFVNYDTKECENYKVF